ncbi:MAG TPA: DUF882 domain-containing protein [Labilithrix sp.]|nr:DUF882 domain-containing protein [Labilithrix sp.]
MRGASSPGVVGVRGAGWALAVVLASAPIDAALASPPVREARRVEHRPRISIELASASAIAVRHEKAPWTDFLSAVEVKNQNTSARAKIRLYAEDGTVDRSALREFMRVAASTVEPPDAPADEPTEPLDSRLVQLAFRAAYHFRGAPIVVLSATRRGSHGKHGTGQALDFRLQGVRAKTLAAYARTYPRAGVGIYTHPKTQFVHLDVRDTSCHWLDGSPPGVTWREKLLADRTRHKRDRAYVDRMDLPEVASR